MDKNNLVIDTIKVAEDPSGLEIVIRIYEAYGGRGTARLSSTIPIAKAYLCNVLEDNGKEIEFDATGAMIFDYAPFKIISLKLKIAGKKKK